MWTYWNGWGSASALDIDRFLVRQPRETHAGAFAIPLVWVFNIEGLLDLLNALFQGLRYTPAGHLGATYFIPAVIVPELLVTHVMVFVLLLRPSVGGAEATSAATT